MENMNNLQKCSLCGQVYHENIIFKANNIFISAENLQEKPSMHLHNYARGGGEYKIITVRQMWLYRKSCF